MKSMAMLATAAACLCVSSMQCASAEDLEWYTAANNGELIPGTTKTFNSYNQPAINTEGLVVFRARSQGGEGKGPGESQPARGIYLRDLAEFGPIVTLFKRGGPVPEPVNLDEAAGKFPTFNEFPSVPRIDSRSDTIATRGQSTPVWGYTVGGSDTRTGTAGVYADLGGIPTTAASMLGDVTENGVQLFPQFQVPVEAGASAGTGFDQFPGSPAVTERTTIVFKGNFTVDGRGKTGVFYRDLAADGGTAPIQFIAASGKTTIPGCKPKDDPSCKFGSTAPPSAGGKYAVFAGYDNETQPNKGGIYRVLMGVEPIVLETIVKIGQQVPGERKGTTFQVFGEAVSVSSTGRTILFWGGWGDRAEWRPVPLVCPDEGSAAMQAACDEATNDGTEPGEDTVGHVPKGQGFFVRDMMLGTITPIVKTGDVVDGVEIKDFVYWNFSGRVAGMVEEPSDDIEEEARWRSATFGAVSGNGVPNISAFKARTVDDKDGIYLRRVLPSGLSELVTLLKTGDCQEMDLSDQAAGMEISAVGLERDGFRGNWLAVTASMLLPSLPNCTKVYPTLASEDSGEVTGWAGIYVARFLDDDLIAY